MHEFSIGEGIVKAVLEEMAKLQPSPRALVKTRVVVGAMHQVIPDSLTFAYELLVQDTRAAGSKLEIAPVGITARCKACGWRGDIHSPFFHCGACKSGEIELLTGNELYLDNLEIEDNDDNEH
jgi:hydrogenase nickel incorporation protein HypA/HybF